MHFISLIFYKDAYLVHAFVVILIDAKSFSQVLFYCFTIIVHISQTWLLDQKFVIKK